ncbi:hypothetical protein D3C80_1841110 [compost metagenome]
MVWEMSKHSMRAMGASSSSNSSSWLKRAVVVLLWARRERSAVSALMVASLMKRARSLRVRLCTRTL